MSTKHLLLKDMKHFLLDVGHKGNSILAEKNYMSPTLYLLTWLGAHALPSPGGAPATRVSFRNAHTGTIIMDHAQPAELPTL